MKEYLNQANRVSKQFPGALDNSNIKGGAVYAMRRLQAETGLSNAKLLSKLAKGDPALVKRLKEMVNEKDTPVAGDRIAPELIKEQVKPEEKKSKKK